MAVATYPNDIRMNWGVAEAGPNPSANEGVDAARGWISRLACLQVLHYTIKGLAQGAID